MEIAGLFSGYLMTGATVMLKLTRPQNQRLTTKNYEISQIKIIKKRISPTRMSLELCRKLGWTPDVVERWIPMKLHPGGGQRKDLFGCIDVLAVTPYGIIGIQACARGSHAARLKKALEIPELREWLKAGAGFVVWSWAKVGSRWGVKAQGVARDAETGALFSLDPEGTTIGAQDGARLCGAFAIISLDLQKQAC